MQTFLGLLALASVATAYHVSECSSKYSSGVDATVCEARDMNECTNNECSSEGTNVCSELCGSACDAAKGAICAFNLLCNNLTEVCSVYGELDMSDLNQPGSRRLEADDFEHTPYEKHDQDPDDDGLLSVETECDPHVFACWGCDAVYYLKDNFDLNASDPTGISWAHEHVMVLNNLPRACKVLKEAGFMDKTWVSTDTPPPPVLSAEDQVAASSFVTTPVAVIALAAVGVAAVAVAVSRRNRESGYKSIPPDETNGI